MIFLVKIIKLITRINECNTVLKPKDTFDFFVTIQGALMYSVFFGLTNNIFFRFFYEIFYEI